MSIILLVALAACQPYSPTPADASPAPTASSVTPVPTPTPPPPQPVEPQDACWTAGQKLLQLGCRDTRGRLLGGPNLSGITWSAVCRQNLANGVDLNAACITAAATCQIAQACK